MTHTAITDAEIFEAALFGLEHQRSQMDERMAELRGRLGIRGGRVSAAVNAAMSDGAGTPVGKRRRFSAAARRHMAAAQRKRWAALKHGTGEPAAPAPAKKKRRISATGRARIIAAT